MAELETREQALAYLAEMSPSATYHVQAIPSGWVCTRALSREQTAAGQSLGLAHLVIDSETGIIYVYPSWSETMVAEAFTEFKQTGVNRGGRRIYPYLWAITIQRTLEDPETIVYQLTANSLNDPPEPTQTYPLTINKRTFARTPRNALTDIAMSYAEWKSRQDNGVWPETATTRV